MRTVLVCVRAPLVAHNVAALAARLGLSAAVRTAASEPEVMLRLAERGCDAVLVDTGLARPDPAAFVRRVLSRAPGAAVLLIGAEERGAAAAAVAAGARGLVQPDGGDLIIGVVKAMLLLAATPRTRRVSGLSVAEGPGTARADASPAGGGRGAGGPATSPAGGGRETPGSSGAGGPATPVRSDHPASAAEAAPGGGEPPAVVPVQRAEDAGTDAPVAPDPRGPGGDAAALSRSPDRPAAPDPARPGPARRADPGAAGAPGRPGPAGSGGWLGAGRRMAGSAGTTGIAGSAGALGVPGTVGPAGTEGPAGMAGAGDGRQRVALTEREMQVLIGMADGKSNAEIGRELFVSEDTVKTHARRLFRKLGARDRAHAVAAGFRAGLVA